jgi:hypothetical protein
MRSPECNRDHLIAHQVQVVNGALHLDMAPMATLPNTVFVSTRTESHYSEGQGSMQPCQVFLDRVVFDQSRTLGSTSISLNQAYGTREPGERPAIPKTTLHCPCHSRPRVSGIVKAQDFGGSSTRAFPCRPADLFASLAPSDVIIGGGLTGVHVSGPLQP